MNITRAGTNSAVTVTPTPQKVTTPSVIKAGPAIQNVGSSAYDLIYVYQGPETPTSESPAFVLQQYALIEFTNTAQQEPIWLWSSSSSGTVKAVLNKAG